MKNQSFSQKFLLIVSLCFSFNIFAGDNTQLFRAIENNNRSAVTKYLEQGISPNVFSRHGYTPLMMAIRNESLPMAELFLEAGADAKIRNKYDETAIMLASYHGQTEIVKKLYVHGAAIDHAGWNPLLYAATNGHDETINLLLTMGADINAAADNGTTALMMAVRGHHPKTVQLLLDEGADPDAQNKAGDTALDWALKRNHQALAKLLKEHSQNE